MAVHNVNLIPISSTSSWSCLYARYFYGLILYIYFSLVSLCLHILCLHVYHLVIYSVHMLAVGHLFCTYETFWLPQVNFMTYFVHQCLFWPISFIYLSFVRLFYRVIFYGYMCTYLWWPILYTHLLFVTYSVYKELFDVLYFTHISPCFMI